MHWSTLLEVWEDAGKRHVAGGTCCPVRGPPVLWLVPLRGVGITGLCPTFSDLGRDYPSAPSTPDPLSKITYNAVDGPTDRRSYHGSYTVQDGLPL